VALTEEHITRPGAQRHALRSVADRHRELPQLDVESDHGVLCGQSVLSVASLVKLSEETSTAANHCSASRSGRQPDGQPRSPSKLIRGAGRLALRRVEAEGWA